MNKISLPAPARVPMGSITVNGSRFELAINDEWARFFDSLTGRTNSNTVAVTSLKSSVEGAFALGAGDGDVGMEYIPGPPGLNGLKGEPGPAVGVLANEGGESAEFVPGPPGATGKPGDPGMALFMLQDGDATASETFIVAPPTLSERGIAPVLTNGWVNFGSGYSTAGYYKDQSGVVHLRGLIASGTSVMFSLPAGYRPLETAIFSVVATNAFGRVDVFANGDVTLAAGSNAYVSLDGITFRAA